MYIPSFTIDSIDILPIIFIKFLQTYQELNPIPLTATFVPRIYGFKIYKKKGSKYAEDNKNLMEMTYYGEDILNKMKNKLNNVLGYGPEKTCDSNEKNTNTKKNDHAMIIEEYIKKWFGSNLNNDMIWYRMICSQYIWSKVILFYKEEKNF